MEINKFYIFFFTSVFLINSYHAQEVIEIPTATDAYLLSYTLDEENSIVTFEVTAETKGFIGFGFSNISGMVQADIFIGGVNEDGTSYFGDYSSVTTGTPRLDAEQDWELLEAAETEFTTYLKFSRPLTTFDANDVNITNSLMNIIWALGERDTLGYHGFSRSNIKFNLIEGTNEGVTPEPPPTPPTTTTRPTTTAQPTTTEAPNFIEIPLGSDLLTATYIISENRITFVVTANTPGFIGFGFSNQTGMTDADMFIGGVNDTNQEIYFGDYISRSKTMPNRDEEEDWTIISGNQVDDVTTLSFSRLLVTPDFMNDVPIEEDKDMNIIWALGRADNLAYHRDRGQAVFNFIPVEETTQPSDASSSATSEPPTTPETSPTPPPTTPPSTATVTTTQQPTTTTEPPPGNGEIPLGTDLLKVTYIILGDTVMFTATAKRTGYIGFGFSNTTGMVQGDIFIGGVTETGEVYYGDYNSLSHVTPARDAQQDWVLMYGSEVGDVTTLVFSRLLNTGDFNDDIVIEDKTMNLIWALGATDDLVHHANRGPASYNLISGQPPPTTTTTTPTTTTLPPSSTGTPPTSPTTESPPGNGEIPLGSDLLKVTYAILEQTVMFTAVSQTKGYIGFGFTNATGMIQGDIFVGGVLDTGDVYFGDYKSLEYVIPSQDQQQDWVLLHGHETENATTLVFSRLLDTGDRSGDDIVIEDKNMGIIWALGSTDELLYHTSNPTRRGQASYNLIAGQGPPLTPPPTTLLTTGDPGTTQAPTPGEIPMGTNLIRVTFSLVESTITFTAVARTTGYVAFGFSNANGMADADIFIAGVGPNNAYYLDCKSSGYAVPELDTEQNWDLISATESGGETTIVFSRLLDTGDAEQDIKIEDKDMTIMWAIGTTDTIEQHEPTNKGLTSYNLIQAPPTLPPMDPLPKTLPFGSDLIKATYSISGENITFQVIGQTQGFIGFGFSNGTGGMNSTDIFIAWVFDDGSVGFVDTFTKTTETPVNDTQQDWVLLSGEQAGGQTRIVFSRPLVTSDVESDVPIEDKYMRIVWAMGFEDFVTYHGESNRGQVSFNLITGSEEGNGRSGRSVTSWALVSLGVALILILGDF